MKFMEVIDERHTSSARKDCLLDGGTASVLPSPLDDEDDGASLMKRGRRDNKNIGE